MNAPLGSADFFALEAGECLDRLERVLTQADAPDASEMLRAARALRGAALMANQTPIARAAAGFESLARGIRDRGRILDAVGLERAAQAVDDLRHLVRRAREWGDADTQRAGRVATELDALAGGAVAAPRLPGSPAQAGSAMGVRAFVAREGALIASSLDRAARAMEATPEAREPLYAVLRRMQSLRGLAELGDLSPLPEILDGIELAVADLTRLFAPPPEVPALLDAAAQALARVSRDIVDSGAPAADPPEAQQFTERLLRAFGSERDVQPITALLLPGPDAITRSSAEPQFAPPSPLGPVELVSHGEHFVQSADAIQQAASTTARDLRLYALVSPLRAAAHAGADPVTPALGSFAAAARDAIATGGARADAPGFTAALREAGHLLRGSADTGLTDAVAERLDRLAATMARLAGVAPPPPAAAPSSADAGIVPIESLAFEGESVFAPAPETATVAVAAQDAIVPIEALAPDDREPLERVMDRYRVLQVRGSQPEVQSPPEAPVAPAEPEVVDIRALCYAGRRALERAAEIRGLLVDGSGRNTDALIAELLDLVPLAMDQAH